MFSFVFDSAPTVLATPADECYLTLNHFHEEPALNDAELDLSANVLTAGDVDVGAFLRRSILPRHRLVLSGWG